MKNCPEREANGFVCEKAHFIFPHRVTPFVPGQWQDNKYSGQGDYTFADGCQYVGQFRDSEYNGQETYPFVDGRKFVGEFRDNKYNGLGTFYAADGSVLEHGIYEKDVLIKAVSQQPDLLSPSKPKIGPGSSQQFPEESQLRQD